MALRDQDALDYHSEGRPGKTEVVPTKPCLTARDLSLAYSPGPPFWVWATSAPWPASP